MTGYNIKNAVRRMSNKELLYFYNRLKKEAESKRATGNYGTGRYVSTHEFWGREGRKLIREEFARRKRERKFSKKAGVSRRRQTRNPYSMNLFGGNFRF
jgi:hypothetical protein